LWSTYLPGYFMGLALCYLHGYFEHAGGTTSHYSAAYNLSFFNDGYHIEHHTRPSTHWTQLPQLSTKDGKVSRWPAVLRWIETVNLEWLETLALKVPPLQWLLLTTHERALRRLLPKLPPIRNATIVGGGMYPRTALLLRRLFPDIAIRIVDASVEHLESARPFLDESFELQHGMYVSGKSEDSDLLVIPLSFSGSREEVYRNSGAPAVLVHDWIWSKRGHSVIVSFLLLKRLNLIVRR